MIQNEFSIQTEFINEIREMLGDELPAFLHALDDAPALALRVNPLRPGAFEAAKEFCGDAVPWARDGYYLKPGLRPGLSVAHELGAFYMQEASAMVSAAVMDAQPGERILDLCAAPGGKSTQLAASMMGEGLLVSNEPVPNRAKILAENLERFGAVNAVAVNEYPDRLAAKWPGFFDGILVDAPCSGEGMFRREPESRAQWTPGAPAGCAKRQRDILDSAAIMLRPGGRLVYSTCTFNRQENEGSILSFLERHPEFTFEDFELAGIGRSENGMLRVWPHRVRGDGHFVARLRKVGGEAAPVLKEKSVKKGGKPKPSKRPATVSEETNEQLIVRLEKEIGAIPAVLRNGVPVRYGDYVHMLPAGAPPLDGIKTAKPGLCLMRVGRSHVQPMPALARAMTGGEGVRRLGMADRAVSVSEEDARRVLAGERLEIPGSGWTLLTFRGLPLAFQKLRG